MRIIDWSSDVCSSDLGSRDLVALAFEFPRGLFPQQGLGLLLLGQTPGCLLRACLFSGVLCGDPLYVGDASFQARQRWCLWIDPFHQRKKAAGLAQVPAADHLYGGNQRVGLQIGTRAGLGVSIWSSTGQRTGASRDSWDE